MPAIPEWNKPHFVIFGFVYTGTISYKGISMLLFRPIRVYFEPASLEYDLGKQIWQQCLNLGITVMKTPSHNRVSGIPGADFAERYREAKRTMVVSVRRKGAFQTSKPSADYALPLATGCPGHCQYCYLNTNLGTRSYVRIYVNTDDILARAQHYIEEAGDKIVTFDGSCTSDPVATESWTGALAKTIGFFAKQKYGRFRFVSKFHVVNSLLNLNHAGHTRIRFSINAPFVAKQFEQATPSIKLRLAAAAQVAQSGYPLGFLIGPIMHYPRWQAEYSNLLIELARTLDAKPLDLHFELVTHRYTERAKRVINSVYPNNRLPMDETDRRFKWGQFGYGKYIYSTERMAEMRMFFYATLSELFPTATVDYFV